MARASSKLATLRSLSWADRRLLTEALLLVSSLRVALWIAPVRRVYATLAWLGAGGEPAGPSEAERVRRVVQAVEMAARNTWGEPTCLHRSLALWWMLRRRGVECHLRFGVRRREGAFEAHAWVEHAGAVINDLPMTAAEYRRLDWLVAGRDA